MNKKKVAQGLFSIAILLVLALLFSEYIESKNKKNSTENCNLGIVDVASWNIDEQILWKDEKILVAYNRNTAKLKKYNWLVDKEKLTTNLESEIDLLCLNPDYNCIQKSYYDKKAELDVLFFKPPYGLIHVKYGNKEMSFPLFWDGKEVLKLASPIRMCNKTFSKKENQYAIFENKLFVFNHLFRQLGTFDLSAMSGAGPSAASREPEELYSVLDSGQLVDSGCNSSQSYTDSLYWLTNRDSFVFYIPEKSFSYYVFSKSLKLFSVNEEKPFLVVAIDNGYLLLEKQAYTFFTDGVRSSKKVKIYDKTLKESAQNADSFYWKKMEFIGLLNNKSWLANRSLSFFSLKDSVENTDKINFDFSFSSRENKFQGYSYLNSPTFLVWEQSYKDDFSIKSVSCK